jgi:hypothetical protein
VQPTNLTFFNHNMPIGRKAAMRRTPAAPCFRRAVAAAVAILLSAGSTPALARGPEVADFPSRQIRLILPFTARSPPDPVLRAMAEDMTRRLA